MVSKLEYEDKYDKAVRYIFGRTLICRNLEVATQLARTTGLDCVTLDGDQVSSKGSLTGGYFNKSRSRLEIQKTRTEKTEEIQSQYTTYKINKGEAITAIGSTAIIEAAYAEGVIGIAT